MIAIILLMIVIVLQIVSIAISLGDTEISRLRKTVERKQLKLNEKALDIQIDNTAVYLQAAMGVDGAIEDVEGDNKEETRKPIGYAGEHRNTTDNETSKKEI